MRRLFLYSLVVALLSACASPPSLPPATIAKVGFVAEIMVKSYYESKDMDPYFIKKTIN